MSALPRALGAPVLTARMRVSADDFHVDELDAFEPTGQGEHLLLTVEKRSTNTAHVARLLADWAGVAEVAIGYAGLKDRHAVTRQRFSVHLPRRVAPALELLDSPEVRVLEHAWHAKKLPRGALAGNRFRLVLRDVEGDRDAIETRLRTITTTGVPNYFGEQRFGRGGDNVDKARAMFAGRRVRREERGHLLSAARSALFNTVLATRVDDGSWNQALDGECWILDGSRSVFGPEPWSDVLAERLGVFDIHPSSPLWGAGELRTTGVAQQLERAALDTDQARPLREGLEAAGLRQERRANRLRPEALAWEWLDAAALALTFALPPGTYATTVLAELGPVRDAHAD